LAQLLESLPFDDVWSVNPIISACGVILTCRKTYGSALRELIFRRPSWNRNDETDISDIKKSASAELGKEYGGDSGLDEKSRAANESGAVARENDFRDLVSQGYCNPLRVAYGRSL
jgi:hypothetical protein